MTRWYHSLIFAFGAATFLLAQHIFAFTYRNGTGYNTASGLLVIVGAFLLLPTVGFFALDRLWHLRSPGLTQWWRFALFFLALWLFLHLARQEIATIDHWFWWVFAGCAVVYWLLAWRFRGGVLKALYIFSLTGLVCLGMFVAQTHLLTKPWRATPVEANGGASSAPPIILIVFDALGRDVLFSGGSVDADRYPNFAQLSEDSLTFTNAASNFGTTEFSIPTMMCGRLVEVPETWEQRIHGLPGLEDGGLLQHWRDEGYQITVISEVYGCGEADTCVTKGQMIQRYPWKVPFELWNMFAVHVLYPRAWVHNGYRTPFPPQTWTTDLWKAFLGDIEHNPRGKAYYVHILFPHPPYGYDRDGFTRVVSYGGQSDWEYHHEKYEQQVAYTDGLLGELLDTLQRAGVYDEATLVVTSDHGPVDLADMLLGSHPESLAGLGPAVPLFIKKPGWRTGSTDAPYQHKDLKELLLTGTFTPTPRTYGRVFIGAGGVLTTHRYVESEGQWVEAVW